MQIARAWNLQGETTNNAQFGFINFGGRNIYKIFKQNTIQNNVQINKKYLKPYLHTHS